MTLLAKQNMNESSEGEWKNKQIKANKLLMLNETQKYYNNKQEIH